MIIAWLSYYVMVRVLYDMGWRKGPGQKTMWTRRGLNPGPNDYKPKVIPTRPCAETRRHSATCVFTRCHIYKVPLQEGSGLASIRGASSGKWLSNYGVSIDMKRIILLTLTDGIRNIKMRLGDCASAPRNTPQTAENLTLAIGLIYKYGRGSSGFLQGIYWRPQNYITLARTQLRGPRPTT